MCKNGRSRTTVNSFIPAMPGTGTEHVGLSSRRLVPWGGAESGGGGRSTYLSLAGVRGANNPDCVRLNESPSRQEVHVGGVLVPVAGTADHGTETTRREP